MQGRQAIAIALLLAALAVAGCGLGPGDDLGQVGVTVTRDFGASVIAQAKTVDSTPGLTALRQLETVQLVGAGTSAISLGGFEPRSKIAT